MILSPFENSWRVKYEEQSHLPLGFDHYMYCLAPRQQVHILCVNGWFLIPRSQWWVEQLPTGLGWLGWECLDCNFCLDLGRWGTQFSPTLVAARCYIHSGSFDEFRLLALILLIAFLLSTLQGRLCDVEGWPRCSDSYWCGQTCLGVPLLPLEMAQLRTGPWGKATGKILARPPS